MKRFINSLSLKLFISLFGIMALVLATYALINLKTISTSWVHSTNAQAIQMSELIKRATHQGMLINRKDYVYESIREIGKAPHIEGIRIFDKQGKIMVSADINETGQEVDMQSEACVLCHKPDQTLPSVPEMHRTRRYRSEDGTSILALTNPIENEPACYTADCHAHPKDQTVLGILDVQLSMGGLDQALRSTGSQIIGVALIGALFMAIGSALFINRIVHHPVRRLVSGANRIASGDLETSFSIKGRGDLALLGSTLNAMTKDLAKAREEITEWSSNLELKVLEKTDELSRSQNQVTQMDKLASLGKLSASVAHELNNPLGGILNYAKLLSRALERRENTALTEEETEEFLRQLKHIQRESSRCGDIVRNLLVFAKQNTITRSEHRLHEIIDRGLMVVQHHLDIANIQLDYTPLEENDQVICDANQIQQALVALFVNAAEAMPKGGTLTIRTRAEEDQLVIDIEDTGEGISAEELPRIFEPFFSTKDKTTGVGIGLAVVYGIMQRHQARITANSIPGKTTFHLIIPRDFVADSGKVEA